MWVWIWFRCGFGLGLDLDLIRMWFWIGLGLAFDLGLIWIRLGFGLDLDWDLMWLWIWIGELFSLWSVDCIVTYLPAHLLTLCSLPFPLLTSCHFTRPAYCYSSIVLKCPSHLFPRIWDLFMSAPICIPIHWNRNAFLPRFPTGCQHHIQETFFFKKNLKKIFA